LQRFVIAFLDEANPQFAIRSPEFKLPNPKGRLSRSVWRQRIAEVQTARKDAELEKLARNRKCKLIFIYFFFLKEKTSWNSKSSRYG